MNINTLNIFLFKVMSKEIALMSNFKKEMIKFEAMGKIGKVIKCNIFTSEQLELLK